MHTQDAYNNWAETYDTVANKTRDLEAIVIRSILDKIQVNHILEIGCGTGKNTQWLADKCQGLTAVDFSAEMLQLAKEKVESQKVRFQQADITSPWTFDKADLVTCSLVLEHIKDLSVVFDQCAKHLNKNGLFYICELHPYKQLQGSRAKFEKDGNLLHLEYFIHHISDFFVVATQHGFICRNLQEWFDSEDRSETPRLVSYLFQKER